MATWITRLDKSGGAGTDVRVYRMRYGDARQVASLLNEMFVGNNGSGLDSPTNQLGPGGGRSPQAVVSQARAGCSKTALLRVRGRRRKASKTPPHHRRPLTHVLAGNKRWLVRPPGQAVRHQIQCRRAAEPRRFCRMSEISADTVNNDLLIYANEESYGVIKRALSQIDRPQLQVAIDATIAEVTLNDTLQYGVQFFIKSTNLVRRRYGSIDQHRRQGSSQPCSAWFQFPDGHRSNPQLIINALHSVTNVKILSNPSLVVVDNQVATLQVGDRIPVTTQSAQSVIAPGAPVVSNVDYRNTGVILRVAPRINANGNVLLNIEQEISAVADNVNANTVDSDSFAAEGGELNAVANGQTVLLAGLVSENQTAVAMGFPAWIRCRGLGELFSQNNGKITRTELIIFIRAADHSRQCRRHIASRRS